MFYNNPIKETLEIKNSNWNEGHLLLGSVEITLATRVSVSEENEKLNKQLRIMSCLEIEAWSISV